MKLLIVILFITTGVFANQNEVLEPSCEHNFFSSLIYILNIDNNEFSCSAAADGIRNILDSLREAINTAVVRLIESQRDNFATGWPAQNIPPIDPFFIKEYNMVSDELAGFSS